MLIDPNYEQMERNQRRRERLYQMIPSCLKTTVICIVALLACFSPIAAQMIADRVVTYDDNRGGFIICIISASTGGLILVALISWMLSRIVLDCWKWWNELGDPEEAS